ACVLPENPASYRVVRTKSYLFNKAVQWGKSAAQQCNASFTLPAREGKATGISQIEAVCR
ncbi:hypothetical protein, partial [Klebsiella variicola]|uniref:hypothetical protein n=1 Tax=Klebsiella variicola TaxID=244366 RepID=UPI002FFAED88